jgi:hypothetical protein
MQILGRNERANSLNFKMLRRNTAGVKVRVKKNTVATLLTSPRYEVGSSSEFFDHL